MSETPASPAKSTEPQLCKMGCGFFGSNATGDMCSKCYASIKPKEEDVSSTKSTKESSGDESTAQKATTEKVAAAVETKVVEETVNKSETHISKMAEKSDSAATSIDEKGSDENKPTTDTTGKVGVVSTADVKSPAKKKKKKATYKNMMAGMLEKSKDRDIDKESEKAIKKVTGGGTFTKIDKI